MEEKRGKGEVLLAALRESDSEVLFGWINDRTDVLLNSTYRPVHETAHRKWFEAIQQRQDLILFAIRTRSDDRLIGTCQLHSIHGVHQSAELQIRIGDAGSRNKGYGTEAVRQLVRFGLRDLNLQRIYLQVFASNARAIAAYVRVGFVREGLLRRAAFIDGKFEDIVLMAVLREPKDCT